MTTERKIFQGEIEPTKNMVEVIQPLGVDLFWSDLEEAKERRKLSEKLDIIFNKIKDVNMDVEEALGNGLILPDELADFYDNFANFIDKDPNHSRIILYLPLELLPNLNKSENKPNYLIEAEDKFAKSYKDGWVRLLFESEIRAEYNDGDVLEPGLGEPSRVRKAGHLTSELIKRGIVSLEEVDLIREINVNDEELINSINEGLKEDNCQENWISFSWEMLTRDLEKIEENYGLGSINDSGQNMKDKNQKGSIPSNKMSRERLTWKKWQEREKTFDKYAKSIEDPETIKLLLKTDEVDPAYKIIGLKAIFNQSCLNEVGWNIILEQWQTGTTQIRDIIIGGLNCYKQSGLDVESYIKYLGIKNMPDLSLPFPVSLEQLRQSDFSNLVEATKKFNTNSILVENIYPIILSFGSKIKGYANIDSDQDVAIFFRPTANWEDREKVLTEIKKNPELEGLSKVCEFWTKENDERIGIKVMPGNIWGVLGPEGINYIFGGVWVGDGQEIKKIQHNLLERYLNLSNFGNKKDLARFQLLRQLENDILRCRLLHKGFRRFYPNKIDLKKKTNQSIDGESAFWDPGFRRVATKLFLSRVFLPDLS